MPDRISETEVKEIEVKEIEAKASQLSPRQTRFSARWLLKAAIVSLFAAALFITLLPVIVTRTPLRNWLLNRASASQGFHGNLQGASLSWWQPLKIDGLFLQRDDDDLRLAVRHAALEFSGLKLLQSWPHVGRVRVEGPAIDLVLSSDPGTDGPQPEREKNRSPAHWTTAVSVRDGSIVIRDAPGADPLIRFDDLQFDAEIHRIGTDRVLTVEPTTILDKQEFTPELFNHGLQFIAPWLARSTRMQGKGSLEITYFRLPLEAVDDEHLVRQADIQGRLAIINLEAGLADPALAEVARKLAGVLAVDLPDMVRLIETDVDFEVRGGRVYHDGLTFLIPQISSDLQWQTRGSVGLDETIDLEVETRLPFSSLSDRPLLRDLSTRPIRFRIEGTIDKPVLRLSQDRSWLQDWSRALLTGADPVERDPTSNGLLEMLDGFMEDRPEGLNLAPVIERLRERREARAEQPTAPGAPEALEADPAGGRGGLLRRFLRRNAPDPLPPPPGSQDQR